MNHFNGIVDILSFGAGIEAMMQIKKKFEE
jgi:hypothetical protein